jgi:iron complex outermembrane receptor protein
MNRPILTASSAAALAAAGLASSPVLAQTAAQPASGSDHPHNEPGAIVVTGHLPSDFALLEGTHVLAGETLIRELKPQLGELLASLPGVSSSAFAPGASRPVIRGFDAERIQVLIDGIGAIDASSVSADHAVSLDTLTIDHVDVIHGPAVLLFGGQAIGGAVNVLDKRIPRRVPDSAEVTGLATLGSAARERSGGAALDVPLGGRFVGHLDASWRKTGDLRVGGRLVSQALRADLLAEASQARDAGDLERAAELESTAEARGRVPNTQTWARTFGAGAAFIDPGGDLGVSVQRYDTRYGVPSRPGLEHEHGAVAIDLGQTRVDLRGGIELGGLADRLLIRAAYGDYGHVEIERSEVGTRFSRQGLEARAELVQARRGAWHGHIGAQYAARMLDVSGDEAIVPANADSQFGIFTLQGFDLGPFAFELAGRYERASVKTRDASYSRHFNLLSGALGASYAPADSWKVGGSYLRGARAPAAEELLSNGVHAATQAFEVGDPTFGKETSDSFEVYARYRGDRARLDLTGFDTRFAGFITALPTGDEAQGFPVFRYAQIPARFRGIEAEGEITARRWSEGELRLEAGADYVLASLKNAGPVPRIPPLRLRGATEAEWRSISLRGEVEWNARQKRTGIGQAPVPGFALVGASATWRPWGREGPLTLILAGDNLFDVVGRRATSFTRDNVPVAGRDLRLTASLRF